MIKKTKKSPTFSVSCYFACLCCECCGPCECPTNPPGIGRWDGFVSRDDAAAFVAVLKDRKTITDDYRLTYELILVGPLGGEKRLGWM